MTRSIPCRACGKPIVFLISKTSGRRMPINASSVLPADEHYDVKRHVSHFSDCPRASEFRTRA